MIHYRDLFEELTHDAPVDGREPSREKMHHE
jgi:hypothetical protein